MSQTTQTNENIMYGQYTVSPASELVKFTVGQPSPKILPLDIVKKGMEYVMSINDPSLLQYGNIPGYNKFRECFASFLTKQYDRQVNYEDLFVTNGITNGITFVCSLMMPAGSTVYVEEPTYFLAINIFKELGLNIVSIPIHQNGIDLDKLEEALKQADDSKPHMLYTIPTFHNPTSYTMSKQKRVRLGKIASQYENFFILADEVYQMLYFDDEDKPNSPLCYYTDKAISLGSFSKILAPSLRMGWIQTKNKAFMKKLTGCGQFDSSGGCTPFVQSIIHGIIMAGELETNIVKCRTFLKDNCLHMANKIQESLADFVDFTVPTGGYFVWLKVKAGIDVSKILALSEKYKIMVTPGTRFSAHKGCKNYIRLSFSYYDLEGINIGVERLCELFKYVKTISDKTLVAVVGHKGKLGSRICEILDQNNMMLIEELDRDMNLEFVDLYSVIIDVSRPEGTLDLLTKLNEKNKKIPLIIGTTGALPKELINEYAKHSPVAMVSNFSIGIPAFINMLKHMNTDQWNISMVEKHHQHKVDAPSGTAKTLQNEIDKSKSVQIESVREGEIIGEHSIMFERDDESLLIEHKAKDRKLFANGAINYVKWIGKQTPGLYYNMFDSKIKFEVYSGCGNDFIMLDYHQTEHLDKSSFVPKHCKMAKTDGAIFVDLSESDQIYWEYYNKDGSTVEMCGNGSRCVVQYAIDHGYSFKSRNPLTVPHHLINNYRLTTPVIFDKDGFSVLIDDNFKFSSIIKYDRDLLFPNYDGKKFLDKQIPLIHIGVPHFVFKLATDELPSPVELGNLVRASKFDTDVNSNLYTKTNGKLYIRTFERGVYDETLACGTGCCAVALYDALLTLNNKITEDVEYEVIVKSGDSLFVRISPNSNGTIRIYLNGPAEKMFEGEFEN